MQQEMYKCQSMSEFLNRFHTRNGEINVSSNKALKQEVIRIRDIFGAELENDIKPYMEKLMVKENLHYLVLSMITYLR